MRSACVRAAAVTICAAMFTLGGCRDQASAGQSNGSESAQAESKKAPAQITVENGQTYITLDAATQKRLGLSVAALSSTVTRAQATLPAMVLSVQELATARNSYIADQAQLRKARLQAEVAAKEYARLKTLNADDKNVSDKVLQAAEVSLRSNEADVSAAEQQLNLRASGVRQEWGPVATNWVIAGSAQLQRVLEGDDALVQMTLPPGFGTAGPVFVAPSSVSLELPGGAKRRADLISAFPRIDPRIQGRSFLYRTSGQQGLAPGMNLVARLPVGSSLRGVVIPASAVVWSEGRAWVYAQVSPERFSRSPVPTDIAVENGFFAAQGFSPGDKIVSVGAQALLSEEMLLHSRSAGEEE